MIINGKIVFMIYVIDSISKNRTEGSWYNLFLTSIYKWALNIRNQAGPINHSTEQCVYLKRM